MLYFHSLESATARVEDEAHPRGSPDLRLAHPHLAIVHIVSYFHSLGSATARVEDEAHPRGSPEFRLALPHRLIVLNCYVYCHV